MRVLSIVLVSLAILGCSKTEIKDPVKIEVDEAWFNQYVLLQEALAADDFETASSAAKSLLEKSTGEARDMVTSASEATDIATLRTAFKPFSESAKDLELPQGMVVAYCPMAFNDTGAHWVQKDGKIMNPYFGAEMLHCGMIKYPKKPK